jgi:hypothetical protein
MLYGTAKYKPNHDILLIQSVLVEIVYMRIYMRTVHVSPC